MGHRDRPDKKEGKIIELCTFHYMMAVALLIDGTGCGNFFYPNTRAKERGGRRRSRKPSPGPAEGGAT